MPANRLSHFYLGGERITDLRGVPGPSERAPEEWLASTTTRFGEDSGGLSALPDGTLLHDAVRADPEGWLGPQHQVGHGTSTGLLVKLLDAGERLPVHVHPDRAFARRHLDCPYGKTEAWYVVEAEPGATCHLGFSREMPADELARHVEAQDADALLDAMHAIEVRAGDGILVPAGLAHAIGEGMMVVEAQEPTDFSVLLEWEGFAIDGPREGHLGLGFETALEATDTRAWGPGEVDALVRRAASPARRVDRLLPVLADPAAKYFRVELARPERQVVVPAGFAVVVVLSGAGEIVDEVASTPARRGDVVAVPYGTGSWALTGEVTAVVCRPAVDGPLAERARR
jgi:mannose-6-phosphate isomerase